MYLVWHTVYHSVWISTVIHCEYTVNILNQMTVEIFLTHTAVNLGTFWIQKYHIFEKRSEFGKPHGQMLIIAAGYVSLMVEVAVKRIWVCQLEFNGKGVIYHAFQIRLHIQDNLYLTINNATYLSYSNLGAKKKKKKEKKGFSFTKKWLEVT